MRARPAAVRAEAVAAISALRRRPRRRLVRTHWPMHSFALAVRVEAAPNGRDRAADGSRRRLGVCANDHASGLRNRGVRDLAADFASV